MKHFILISILSLFTFSSCDTANMLFGEPSEAEILHALQNLLDNSAVDALSTMQDINKQGIGGVLPEELRPVLEGARMLGIGSEIDNIESTLQTVSATALTETTGTMKDAIKSLQFKDAVAVVLGGEDAATQVLRQAMYSSVKQRYSNQLGSELEKTDPNIENYWRTAASAYNLLAKEKVDASLTDFIAERSVDLLFSSMGKKEKAYRDNIPSLGDQITSKVFDYYKGQQKVNNMIEGSR